MLTVGAHTRFRVAVCGCDDDVWVCVCSVLASARMDFAPVHAGAISSRNNAGTVKMRHTL